MYGQRLNNRVSELRQLRIHTYSIILRSTLQYDTYEYTLSTNIQNTLLMYLNYLLNYTFCGVFFFSLSLN